MKTQLTGRAWKFGNDINTDLIIPARYLNTTLPEELAAHLMEDEDPDFCNKYSRGDFIVAQKNFGCGSSREHAPLAIKAGGIAVVIAQSFARIFYRNAINIGLPILESRDAADRIEAGDEIQIDLTNGIIANLTRREKYQATQFPDFMQELISAGGLMSWIKKERVNR